MANRRKPAKLGGDVRELNRRALEEGSVADVQYGLYLRKKVRRGEESLRNEGGISHAQVKRRVALFRKN